MRRIVVTLLASAFLLLFVGMAWADAPLLLSHTLKGSSKGPDSVTWNFALHVINNGDTPVRDLALSYVPLLVMARDEVNLNISEIAGHGETDVPFELTVPVFVEEREVSTQPFHWAGNYLDDQGKPVEFPAESNQGGVL